MRILLRLLRAAVLIRLITLILPSSAGAQAAPARPDSSTARPAPVARGDSARDSVGRGAGVRRDSAQRVGAFQVTATFAATRVLDAPQPMAVIGGAELRRAQGAAVGDALEQLPGIRSLSMTTGIGKPV